MLSSHGHRSLMASSNCDAYVNTPVQVGSYTYVQYRSSSIASITSLRAMHPRARDC